MSTGHIRVHETNSFAWCKSIWGVNRRKGVCECGEYLGENHAFVYHFWWTWGDYKELGAEQSHKRNIQRRQDKGPWIAVPQRRVAEITHLCNPQGIGALRKIAHWSDSLFEQQSGIETYPMKRGDHIDY